MSRKKPIIIAAAVVGLLVLLLVVVMVLPYFGSFETMRRQMHAGKRYMDSLSDAEIQKWIDRSKAYMAHADPKEYPIGARPVPEDLKTLKILRIDLRTNSVVYVWCGGLDHTCLSVSEKDGSYKVIAGYDDQHSKVLWPKN